MIVSIIFVLLQMADVNKQHVLFSPYTSCGVVAVLLPVTAFFKASFSPCSNLGLLPCCSQHPCWIIINLHTGFRNLYVVHTLLYLYCFCQHKNNLCLWLFFGKETSLSVYIRCIFWPNLNRRLSLKKPVARPSVKWDTNEHISSNTQSNSTLPKVSSDFVISS